MINLLLLFLVFFFFCVWVLALKEAIFFCGYFGNAFKAPLRMQPREPEKSVSSTGVSLLQERFLQVESLKRGFVKVGVG